MTLRFWLLIDSTAVQPFLRLSKLLEIIALTLMALCLTFIIFFQEIFLRHYAIRSNWRHIHKSHYFFNLAIPLFDRSWLEQTNPSAKFHERFVNVCNINLTLSGSILTRFDCFRRKKVHDLVSSMYVTQPQKAAN